jgi:hypothetical protein
MWEAGIMARWIALPCLLTAVVVGGQFGAPKEDKPKPKPKAKPGAAEQDPFAPAGDPFGGGGDPFGGGGDPFGGGGDPFGGPANPFARTPAPADEPDPFAPGPSAKARSPKERERGGQPAFKPPYPSLTLESPSERAAREQIQKELAQSTSFQYLEEPLGNVLEDVSHRHDIPVVLDAVALDDYGIAAETPVTINISDVSLRSALTLMLRPFELTFSTSEEVLHVTTVEEAEQRLMTRFYQIAELLPQFDRYAGAQPGVVPFGAAPPPGGVAHSRGTVIVTLIQSQVAPQSWDQVGGPGTIQFVEHLETLVVSQTEDVLFKIEILLAKLKEIVDEREGR